MKVYAVIEMDVNTYSSKNVNDSIKDLFNKNDWRIKEQLDDYCCDGAITSFTFVDSFTKCPVWREGDACFWVGCDEDGKYKVFEDKIKNIERTEKEIRLYVNKRDDVYFTEGFLYRYQKDAEHDAFVCNLKSGRRFF